MEEDRTREIERILLENYNRYYRAAYSYTGNQADALDVVQESAFRAIREGGKVRQKEYLPTWIYRIVVNAAVDVLRRRKREAAGEPETEEGREDRYRDLDLEAALGRLEEKERIVVILRYFEDLKLEEIAEVTGDKVNTVKARLYRSLRKLRADLESGEPKGKEER